MKNHVKIAFLGVVFILLIGQSTGCRRNDNAVPSVAVDEYLNLELPEFIKLNAVNNWIYYNYAGNRGIIVVRTSPTDFLALERTCTFDPSVNSAYVTGIPDDIFCIDSTCMSKFSLLDGSVVNGPASQPLLRYRTQLISNKILHIFN